MDLIEGRQPIREALRAGRPISRILISEGAKIQGTLQDIVALATAASVSIERVPSRTIDSRAQTDVHQGVVAEAADREQGSWRDAVARARERGVAPLLLALDGIEDPQNLGALLRTAEVLGVDAVLVPRRRSAPLGPGVAKASAGAIEHLVIEHVNSLERALADCRADGLWIVALAGEGDQLVTECPLLEEPLVIIVGAEGRGVSVLVRKRADAVVRIQTKGLVTSLNASVAGAICLWEAARHRR